jgi:hypothetical protein
MSSAWKRAIVVVALVLAVVAGWFALRGDRRAPVEREVATAKQGARIEGTGARESTAAEAKVARRARVSRAERDAVYRRILDGLARRSGTADEAEEPSPADPVRADPSIDGAQPQRDPIRNRLGDDDGWGDVMSSCLSDDFGPLADECIADARERAPELAGMAAIEFTVVADEDIGGVVESADAAPDNEIDDPGFIECMRESMLSTVLPPPPGSGRRQVKLTMPY